jgi:uncharacterized protein
LFTRIISPKILEAAETFYAVSVVGPRQSGKTTLLKMLFPQHRYLNLEDLDTLEKIRLDPKGFLSDKESKWIIDEAQEYPELFSFLLGIIDNNKVKGQFILSGSQNFALINNISQSLAGRVAILELLPLTYQELSSYGDYASAGIWDLIYQGSYPGTYHDQTPTDLWYKSYITTYLQRDVRQLLKVKDLSQFHLFLRLCAGRHGQLTHLSELGAACGVSHTTISEWLSVLEASFIIFRLPPYYKNFNKRLVKMPKLYFYDSGLVCHLLGIESGQHAAMHAARGPLFEGFVISEIIKQIVAEGKTPHVYFWHSQQTLEIDLLIERGAQLRAVEIKSSSTFTKDFLVQLKKWQAIYQNAGDLKCYVVYSGTESFVLEPISVISYQQLDRLFV